MLVSFRSAIPIDLDCFFLFLGKIRMDSWMEPNRERGLDAAARGENNAPLIRRIPYFIYIGCSCEKSKLPNIRRVWGTPFPMFWQQINSSPFKWSLLCRCAREMDSSCQRCEWRAENAYKNLDDRRKYFLVPMKGDFQQSMIIPDDMVECFRGEVPAQVSLETRNHNSYTVGVTKYSEKIVFSAGWAAFVDTFDLNTDDSILFRYTGNFQFNVVVFNRFGCEEPLSVLEDYALLHPRVTQRCKDGVRTTKYCENCKDYDEDKYHDLDNEEKYFLVPVKGDCQHDMTVPEEFVHCFKGEFPGEIKVETRNGYSYPIEVSKYPDKVVFSAGWEAFSKTYNLHMDDSMVFKYNGNSQFHVTIFSQVGCEKASSVVLNSAPVPLLATKRRRDGIKTVSRAHNHSETMQIQSLPRERETQLHTDSTSQGNKTMFNFPATSPGSSVLKDGHLQLPPQLLYRVANKSHLSGNQKKKVEEIVQSIYSGIQIFVIVIGTSNVSGKFQLNLPKQYTKTYIGLKERIIFLERGGQRHEAKLHIGQVARFSNGGWQNFVKANNVEVGDICLFQLLKDGEILTMNVHIIRTIECSLKACTSSGRPVKPSSKFLSKKI
ncbi:hypothetical protein ACP70R_025019 [Stipagrostis hirtigluma subsp. patula]